MKTVLGLVLMLALAGCAGRGGAPQPRLAVLIVIDQLRPDGINPAMPGGLGRLLREGRSFPDAIHAHGLTETCPGHAAIGTGRHPGAVGVSGNEYIDPQSGRDVYCVDDPRPEGGVFGAPRPVGRSPAALHATALGDWLKAAVPEARVFGVAGKDRSAITLAGQHPDAAYWFESDGAPRFTSSRYYMGALPEWVQSFSAGIPQRVPPTWVHAPDLAVDGPDDAPGESPRFGRTSGHPVGAGDPASVGRQIYSSPFVDELTLGFARELIEREGLGTKGPDLLLISLSGHDVVGHLYGPESHEAADERRRIDLGLAELLRFLESRGPLVVALSSDHGVLSLPEWLEAHGQTRCPVPGGRMPFPTLAMALQQGLQEDLGADALRAAGESLLHFAGPQLGVDRQAAAAAGVPVDRVVAAVRRALASQPVIARTWTPAEVQSGTDPIAELYRHSLDPSRPPDLFIQVAEGCLISEASGTTHGSPYLYDRAIPLVFWGTGVRAGSDPRPAATIDIAPTLAGLLGIAVPAAIDGRSLLPLDGEGSR